MQLLYVPPKGLKIFSNIFSSSIILQDKKNVCQKLLTLLQVYDSVLFGAKKVLQAIFEVKKNCKKSQLQHFRNSKKRDTTTLTYHDHGNHLDENET